MDKPNNNEYQDDGDAIESLGQPEFDSTDAMSDVWDQDNDDFEFEAHPDQEVEIDIESGSEGQIGLLLSAISGESCDQASETVNSESEACASDDDSTTPHDIPEFETLHNSGDATAIAELMNDPALREAYLDDALKCLGSMEQSALSVEDEPENKEAVQQFCRELHTLKGASASVGLSELATYLHVLESSLDDVFKNESASVDTPSMFNAVDRVRDEIAKLSCSGESENSGPIDSALPRKQDFSTVVTSDDASIRIRAVQLDRLMDMLAELVVLRNRRENHATEFNELNDELARCATRLQFAEEQDEFQVSLNTSSYPVRNGSQTMSEIAKDISAVAQGLSELQTPVSHDNKSISRFIGDFRQELMQLRRVPVSGLFHRLQRAVRDAANSEGKKVRLQVRGENTGLEQEIQERLFEPLLHIVRNAVSHGVELPDKRLNAGKDETGLIVVEAHSNAQRLVIEVRDDGAGIDFAAVRNRAIEKGLIAANQLMSDSELGKLIFHPGFSTRDQASEVSGRGVGMDIVASTMEHLCGRVDVESELELGTTMRLTIPLKTGIEHVMVFRSAEQLFALPMQSVKAVNASGTVAKSIQRMSLKEILSLRHDRDDRPEDLLILRTSQNNEEGSQSLALAVDEIVGPEEVVIRGLPSPLQSHPLFCGVTLSRASETVLLLDSQRLEEFCAFHQSSAQFQHDFESGWSESENQQRALVVDDSMTARKVLVKKLLARGIVSVEAVDGIEALERLHREQFDWVFTDLDMPRLGGIELLTDIQSQKYTDAPVIVVSSRSEDEFRAKAMELGAAAYLSKPIQHEPFTKLMEDMQILANNSQ